MLWGVVIQKKRLNKGACLFIPHHDYRPACIVMFAATILQYIIYTIFLYKLQVDFPFFLKEAPKTANKI